jgi:hypothetical protein
MLRAEQSHKIDTGGSQSHHITDTLGIDTRLVGYQANPAVANQMHTVLEQHYDAGAHGSVIIGHSGTGCALTSSRGAADPPSTHTP